MDEREILDVDVDRIWLREWTQAGLAELESYLAKWAAFADFLRVRHVLESDNGDGTGCV